MNIIVVCIDTLRYDAIGANGNARMKTPDLDRLAARSRRFDRAFTASFPTIPHRTDTLTGRYGGPFHPWRPLRFDVTTIPQALHAAGYCTQLIHDTPHLVNGGHAFDAAFNAWTFVRGAEVDRAWLTDRVAPVLNWGRDPIFDFVKSDPMATSLARNYCWTNRGRKRLEDWNAMRLFRTAAEWLKDNARRRNFFLWVDSFDPHEPWDAPPEFVKLYDRTPGYDGRIDPRAFLVHGDPALSAAAVARIRAHYAAKVSLMDRALGQLLDALDETKLARRTAVILTSDHGTRLYERKVFGKSGVPDEPVAHVPVFVRAPGLRPGRSGAIVQPQDLFATVCALAGVKPLKDIESFDLLAQAKSGRARRRIALAGHDARSWREKLDEKPLFTVFDADWCLEFRRRAEESALKRLGDGEDVAEANPRVVKRLHAAARREIARRGLDPELVAWLNATRRKFPAKCRLFDAEPYLIGWEVYWSPRRGYSKD